MKKRIVFFLSSFLLLGAVGCSDDSNDDSTISVNFLIQDENGSEKYLFNEGENIIFRLDIINDGKDDVVLLSPVEILGNDIFHVYSSKGEDLGRPYDILIIPEIAHTFIPSQSRVSFRGAWVNDPESELTWTPNFLQYEIDKLRPLPKGDYYSEFTIKLDNNRNVTCKKTFKIN